MIKVWTKEEVVGGAKVSNGDHVVSEITVSGESVKSVERRVDRTGAKGWAMVNESDPIYGEVIEALRLSRLPIVPLSAKLPEIAVDIDDLKTRVARRLSEHLDDGTPQQAADTVGYAGGWL